MKGIESVEESIRQLLESRIRNVPDFPKPGIQFKDVTPLLQDPNTLELTSQLLARPFRGQHVDHVMGIESRGFLFGTNLAQDLHAGFVAVRKPNKLPHEVISATYALEYGEDSVEIHKDSFERGEKVVIHDDLIATGGSAAAATRLAKRLGAEVVGYSFIIELEALNGRSNLPEGVPVHSLISY